MSDKPEQPQNLYEERFCIVNRGQVLVLESDGPMTTETYHKVREALDSFAEKSGIKIVILPYGIRAARIRDNV